MKILKTTKMIGRNIFNLPAKRVSVYPHAARLNAGTYVIGQPGMGKTKLILSLILQDIRAGVGGVGVIDVHGDLFRELTWYLAAMSIRQPELARRIVIIDPTDPDWTVSFNPLAAIEGTPYERQATFLNDVVITIWKVDPTQSPRMVDLLNQTFVALADLGLTLLDVPRWLQDANWRNNLLPQLRHQAVYNFFKHEFPRSDKEARVWIAPVLNKLRGLLFDPDLRPMMAGNTRLDFRQILDRRLILLVHLPKGIIGEGNSALLGAFIVAQLQKAALARADSSHRPPFIFYLDEFQNYTSTSIRDVLSESRKFSLGLVLAHQFLGQLSSEMQSAVISTSKTLISFRIGYRDARTLVPDIFPYPDFLIDQGISNWEGLALELANLPQRHFWIRRRGVYVPDKKRTLDMPTLVLTPQIQENLSKLREISGRYYGRNKRELLAEIEANQHQPDSASPSRKRRKKKKPVKSDSQSATLIDNDPSGSQANHPRSQDNEGTDDGDFWHD